VTTAPAPIVEAKNFLEVEAALLDAAMRSASEAERIVSIMSPEDFISIDNRDIFNAIMDVRVAGQIVDPGAVGEALARRGRVDSWATMSDLIARPSPIVIPATSITEAVASLKERRTKRRIQELVREGGVSAVRDFLGTVREIGGAADDGRITPDQAEEFMAMIRRNAKMESLGPPTGIKALDRATFGLVPSFLWAIGGPTSGGKTLLAVQCVVQTLLWGGRAAYFSAEIPKRWLFARLAGAYLGIASNRIFRGRLTEREEIMVEGAVGLLAEMPLHTFRNEIELYDICRRARGIKATYGKLDLVVIDFIQNIQARGTQTINERMALIAMELQNLAADVDTCVIAVSQQSNDAVREKGKGMLNFRFASEVSHACDVGIEIIPSSGELRLAKNRAGQTGIIKVAMTREWTAYSQVGQSDELEQPT
jgi:replicative DNA helicase